jgi:hypothetical protein
MEYFFKFGEIVGENILGVIAIWGHTVEPKNVPLHPVIWRVRFLFQAGSRV